jgi:hypothetical protein
MLADSRRGDRTAVFVALAIGAVLMLAAILLLIASSSLINRTSDLSFRCK